MIAPQSRNGGVYIENEWIEQQALEVREEKVRKPFADFVAKLFKHKGAVFGAMIILLFVCTAVFAPWLAPYEYDKPDISVVLQPPSAEHLFGTDEFGRDIFSRIVYGARISLRVAFVAVGISLVIGTVLGALAGYYGGVVDYIITSITDIAWSFPTTLLAIAFIAALGTGVENVIIAIALASWAGYCRVVRGQFLSLREREFVQAARILGMSDARIIFRHMLPNALAPVIFMATLELPKAIVIEASLSFLGLGAQPPEPSWGVILDSGKGLLDQAPWISFFPGLMIMLVVLGFNLFGDALRDVLDPNS
ncbi:ABC transporter permease [Caldicoprobacter algeriensis]|uniref:ABC transporter permease n=1 Tax=Caldicoprobacter algeriensis TaxID=699281 RepID=UPI0020795813|nr:ABC transporter permease [Caldicoprobacter algeriensis]MCM8901241.1 ABC transporter permease [Caldicoprobacter algeriensis]